LHVQIGLQPAQLLMSFLNERDKRAVGVEFTSDPVSCPDAGQSSSIVRASKLVVVSAGAFGSPAILERSGIGAEAILKRCDIEQLVDLPGVGENYQGL
jgi:alcohol oxidase